VDALQQRVVRQVRVARRGPQLERVLAVHDPERLPAGHGAHLLGAEADLERVAGGHDGGKDR
jgi:hypothetical protein